MRVEKSGNDLTEEVMGELGGVEGVEGGGESDKDAWRKWWRS